ncbi:hypothetical protein ACQWF3_24835, partial [Salmonella enterica subsp. enterica serovar Infantis]
MESKHIMMERDNSQNVHVWFCGPAGFAKSLLSGLQKYGISEKAFHYDRFNLRLLLMRKFIYIFFSGYLG